jgi:hypothetical protein
VNSASVPYIELSALSLGNRLGKGGQGQVTEVSNIMLNKQWPAVVKEYSLEAKQALRVAALETITGFPGTLAHQDGRWLHESTAWPAAVVQEHGVVCGFLMRAVPPAFYFDFQTQTRGVQRRLADMAFLLNPETYVRGSGIVITDRARVRLLASVAAALSRLHGFEITVGDLSPKNLLFSLSPAPSCFLIDCDAVRLRGATVLDQIETPDWEAPAGEPRATKATDAFKFGLLATRFFARDQSSRDTSALAAVSAELGHLAQLSQQREPRQRPSMETWITALNAAALSVGPTTAPRASAPRPTAAPLRIPVPVPVPVPTAYPTTARPSMHQTGTRPALYTTLGLPAAPSATATVFPRPIRRRLGRRLLIGVLLVVVATVIGVLAHSAIGSVSSAAKPVGIGDSCLIGTWRDGEGHNSTRWNGQQVSMYGGGGDIDHMSASGTDEDTWGVESKPLYGTYQGHALKEMIRGYNTLAIHAMKSGHRLSVTEDGWSAASTNRFVYEGRRYSGYLSQHGTTYYNYECTASKFKLVEGNRTVDRETRISRIP